MFTGLVTHRAKTLAIARNPEGGMTLSLSNPFPKTDPVVVGESIAVNGCCLTALAIEPPESERLTFFISAETLARATFAELKADATVNLERAMQAGQRFGGHIVSGHIDCRGVISASAPESGSTQVTVDYPADYGSLLIPKGSVTIDGVSLTVNTLVDEVTADGMRRFTVNIIPHTYEHTGFKELQVGDTVNLEFDMLAKFALRHAILATEDTTPEDRLTQVTVSTAGGN